jgi:hypothetical protein
METERVHHLQDHIVQDADFDFSSFSGSKCDKKWLKVIRNKSGNKYNLLSIVLKDAKEGKRVLIKGGSYYSCARFLKRYYKTFTFKKEAYSIITCCNSYPKECGGVCCFQKRIQSGRDECGCGIIPSSIKHLNNCYDDCCNIFKYVSKRKFYLIWNLKV